MIDLTSLPTSEWLEDAQSRNKYTLGLAVRNYQYPLLSELYADYTEFQARNTKLPISKQMFRQDLEVLYSTTVVQSTGYRIKGIIHSTPETDTKPTLKLPSSTTESIDLIQSLISHPTSNPLYFLMENYEIRTQDLLPLNIIIGYIQENKKESTNG